MCLLQEVLHDRGTWCSTSTDRDFKRITARVKHEGLSFLTITLPLFGQDLQKGLDQGYVDSALFLGYPRSGGLPVFLRGFLSLVFDSRTGRLLDEPDIAAIQAIRQITLMFAKINLPCSPAREAAAISQFVKCELEIRDADQVRTVVQKTQFKRIGGILWREVLQVVDEHIYYGRLMPKHGPGATADRLAGNRKYEQREWTSRLEYLFPHGEYLYSGWGAYLRSPHVEIHEPGAERPVKVITVPKTLKTPRIIAVEPTCMQYTQQAVLEVLVDELETKNTTVSRRLVGFSDQDPNRSMAEYGSRTGTLATLDLSEASDRVSNQLVRLLAHDFPHFSEALDATRSRKADVPGHGVLRLAKFASMGSALCFPIEAMVFTTLVFAGIEDALRRPLTASDISRYRSQVRVYGDDIIVPVEFVHSVVRKLEDFGLRVNTHKSFWTGKFRESCGKEYYDGHDVSIVKVRTLLPTSRKNARELVSTVSLRNQLYQAGYWSVCRALDDHLQKFIPMPMVASTSSVLGRLSFLGYETQRMSPVLHAPLVKGHVVHSVIPSCVLEGDGALLKWFLKRGRDPFADRRHLERSGRPKSVCTKLRWAQPF
nr:MAG: RNA dependent RNA polymerase [Leviviridae sp.]